ncbi:MAG: hypothetical protein QM723_35925 [Myxococcaceae bacterium]
MSKHLIALMLSLSFTAVAAAPKGKNLGDAQKWKESEQQINQTQTSAEKACGEKITIAYDDKSFGTLTLDEAKPADTFCRDAYNALWGSVCKSPGGKEAVLAKVTAMTCRLSTAGTNARLEGKTLVIEVDPKNKKIDGRDPGSLAWSEKIKSLL